MKKIKPAFSAFEPWVAVGSCLFFAVLYYAASYDSDAPIMMKGVSGLFLILAGYVWWIRKNG